jgi:hypothetical protein
MDKLSYSPNEAAAVTGYSIGTLGNMRSAKTGPKYFKRGRKVIYMHDDLIRWLTANPVMTEDARDLERG